jgi:hypothetical protein
VFYPCKTTMILHTYVPQHSKHEHKLGKELWVVESKLPTFTTR